MADRIVYTVITNAGGVDGRDHTDKGGPKYATFDKADAEAHKTSWDRIETSVIDVESAKAEILKSLSPLGRLLFGLNPPPRKKIKATRMAR